MPSLGGRKADFDRPLWERHRELEQSWRDACRLRGEAEREAHTFDVARTEARRELARAHASGDLELVEQREAALGDREREADRHALKIEGLGLAEQEREQALQSFQASNLEGLLAELAPEAHAASEELERALYVAVPAAVERYRAMVGQVQTLVTSAGRGRDLIVRDVPPVAQSLVREVQRAEQVAIPVPLPEGLPSVRLLTTEGNLVDAAATTP
jgi:hypothetical protein